MASTGAHGAMAQRQLSQIRKAKEGRRNDSGDLLHLYAFQKRVSFQRLLQRSLQFQFYNNILDGEFSNTAIPLESVKEAGQTRLETGRIKRPEQVAVY